MVKEFMAFWLQNIRSSRILVIYLISLVYLFLLSKKYRWRAALPSLLLVAGVLNPVAFRVLFRFYNGMAWRALWIIFAVPVIFLALADLLKRIRRTGWKATASAGVAALCAVFVLQGSMVSCVSADTVSTSASDTQEIPEAMLHVADALLTYDKNPDVIADADTASCMKKISGRIHLLSDQDSQKSADQTDAEHNVRLATDIMGQDSPDPAALRQLMTRTGFAYVILPDSQFVPRAASYKKLGFRKITRTSGYSILKLVKHRTGYTITQYASTTGNQGSFWVIQAPDGRVAVIDGGYTADSGYVRDVLYHYGDHVTSWIITHAHPDHVGALNQILSETDLSQYSEGQPIVSGDLTIDHIYAPEVNSERYLETAKDYDAPETFQTFLALTQNLPQVSWLKENDELDLIGLKMKVLHAWDSHVEALENNLLNDGSLAFRLDGEKNSFLFLADTQKEMEHYIIQNHAEELKADYVQCGHHGNWGMNQDFYSYVEPKTAFFDAPTWITDDTTGKYDGPELKQWFADHKVRTIEFANDPYSILFQ